MTPSQKPKRIRRNSTRTEGELAAHDPARRAAYDEHRKRIEASGLVPPCPPLLRKQTCKKTPGMVAIFIEHLAKGWTVAAAATIINTSRRSIEKWKSEDPDFRELFDEAIDAGTDFIEQEARRRAVDGVDEPVFQQGECVGFKRNYSDSLMQMLLSGRRPEKYGKQRHEVSGPDGQPVKYDVEVSFVGGDKD